MKHLNKFLLLVAIFALTGSMASVTAQSKGIPETLGEYVGQLHVVATTFGLDETYDGVTMELRENAPNDYRLKVAAMELPGGINLPEYEMQNVVFTPQGSGYKLTSSPLNIVIDEIVTPLGTFTNVPVAITLENGSFVENNVLTLVIKAVATVTIIIPIPVTINIGFVGDLELPPPPPDCDPVTNAKAQIENCEKAIITWNTVSGAVGYEIRRDGTLLGTVTAPTYIENFTFEHGQSYTWTIKTICEQNASDEVSVSATADCEEEVCCPVTGATAAIEACCELATIMWTEVSGATGYKIIRDGIEPVTVIEPTYTEESTFEDGVTYTWVIVTICGDTESTLVSISTTANCCGSINELSNSISVFPNPTDGELIINNEQLTINNVEIFDMLGRMVETRLIASLQDDTASTLRLDISSLPSGIYFLQIQTEKGTITKRVVKK